MNSVESRWGYEDDVENSLVIRGHIPDTHDK
jgi:hypothetical protein